MFTRHFLGISDCWGCKFAVVDGNSEFKCRRVIFFPQDVRNKDEFSLYLNKVMGTDVWLNSCVAGVERSTVDVKMSCWTIEGCFFMFLCLVQKLIKK